MLCLVSELPTSLVGPAEAISARQLADFRLPGGDDKMAQARMRRALTALWGKQATPTGKAAQAALDVSATMTSLAKDAKPANGAKYPDGDLGLALAAGAQVIKAGVGVRVITLDYGGWDMHVDLGTVANGDMKNRVGGVAKAVAAFFTDLGSSGDKVTLVTLSEFGRRVQENGSRTDHGYGNTMLLFGGVRGGKVHGTWPGLSSGKLVDGDLAVTTDYRGVLSEVIAARFPDVSTAGVFPGFSARSPLGVMRAN